jgi:hypothetical protein
VLATTLRRHKSRTHCELEAEYKNKTQALHKDLAQRYNARAEELEADYNRKSEALSKLTQQHGVRARELEESYIVKTNNLEDAHRLWMESSDKDRQERTKAAETMEKALRDAYRTREAGLDEQRAAQLQALTAKIDGLCQWALILCTAMTQLKKNNTDNRADVQGTLAGITGLVEKHRDTTNTDTAVLQSSLRTLASDMATVSGVTADIKIGLKSLPDEIVEANADSVSRVFDDFKFDIKLLGDTLEKLQDSFNTTMSDLASKVEKRAEPLETAVDDDSQSRTAHGLLDVLGSGHADDGLASPENAEGP